MAAFEVVVRALINAFDSCETEDCPERDRQLVASHPLSIYVESYSRTWKPVSEKVLPADATSGLTAGDRTRLETLLAFGELGDIEMENINEQLLSLASSEEADGNCGADVSLVPPAISALAETGYAATLVADRLYSALARLDIPAIKLERHLLKAMLDDGVELSGYDAYSGRQTQLRRGFRNRDETQLKQLLDRIQILQGFFSHLSYQWKVPSAELRVSEDEPTGSIPYLAELEALKDLDVREMLDGYATVADNIIAEAVLPLSAALIVRIRQLHMVARFGDFQYAERLLPYVQRLTVNSGVKGDIVADIWDVVYDVARAFRQAGSPATLDSGFVRLVYDNSRASKRSKILQEASEFYFPFLELR